MVNEYVVRGNALYSFYSVYCNEPHYKGILSKICDSCSPLYCESSFVDKKILEHCSKKLDCRFIAFFRN